MNKEQQELVEAVYGNYTSYIHDIVQVEYQIYGDWYGKKEFIKKCKTDSEFSKKWGLKIEERELNHDERFEIYKKVSGRDLQPHISGVNFKKFHFDEYKIPVKLITITYNDKTIESYE